MELDIFKLERTRDALANQGVECALFHEFYNVSYLTGYTFFLENGLPPFTRGMAAALLVPGKVTLVADLPADTATSDAWAGETIHYQGYHYEAGVDVLGGFVEALVTVFEREAPHVGKIGIEKRFLPAVVFERLQAARPNVTWVDLPESMMLYVRAVKSPTEIEKLRACARLAEVGQEAVRKLSQKAGLSEIEIYSQAKAEMEKFVGGRFALQNALHAGPNAANGPFPGMPTDYVTKRGDTIISDMVPYLNGYWGDSCSTFVIGGADAVTDELRVLHQVPRDAFMIGFESAKPGVKAGDLEAVVRDYVRQHAQMDYPHHTGHGVGVSNHEEPRIISNGQTLLEAGMVVLLEPAVYRAGVGGVRQERMILITDTGAEFLSHNSLELA